jgi:exodeoxyribonuclease VII large subunit
VEIKRWSVGELTRYIRQMFETDYRLQEVEVEGEVSNWRAPGSGHAYFTLKDAEAQLRCVMWKSDVAAQASLPHDGERVVAHGHLGVYEAGGQYQLYCRLIRPAGLGDLFAQFEALKAKLQAEGLFDPARKRPLPERPAVIGVVTSPSAAAFQDVLNVLRRRYPLARVILSPTAVQGDQAPAQIVAALEAIRSRPEVEVILIVRGGGSLEDLWCFNDERVARAVAASPEDNSLTSGPLLRASRIPVVSGVGHEIDFTLTDFAADLRAATPTAAAELVTPVTRDDLRAALERARASLAAGTGAIILEQRRQIEGAAGRLKARSPQARLDSARQRLDGLLARAGQAAQTGIDLRRERIAGMGKALAAMNPGATLARGYAIVRGEDGRVIRRAVDAPAGTRLNVRLSEGAVRATVDEIE